MASGPRRRMASPESPVRRASMAIRTRISDAGEDGSRNSSATSSHGKRSRSGRDSTTRIGAVTRVDARVLRRRKARSASGMASATTAAGARSARWANESGDSGSTFRSKPREWTAGRTSAGERSVRNASRPTPGERSRRTLRLRAMARQLALLSRSYRLRAERFEVTTEDGVRLAGDRLGNADVALVFCHGFLGWHRKPRLVRFQEELARRFTVYAFDFRGHGRSGGRSSFGVDEVRDIEAVVRLARKQGKERVVTFGGSMGGIAVIRHAALLGGIDGVV